MHLVSRLDDPHNSPFRQGTEKAFYGYDGTLLTELRYQGLLDETLGYGYNPDFQINSLSYAGGATPVAYDDDQVNRVKVNRVRSCLLRRPRPPGTGQRPGRGLLGAVR